MFCSQVVVWSTVGVAVKEIAPGAIAPRTATVRDPQHLSLVK